MQMDIFIDDSMATLLQKLLFMTRHLWRLSRTDLEYDTVAIL